MGFLSAFNKKPATACQHFTERLSMRIGAYLQRLDPGRGQAEERALTLIARSPASEIARALAFQADNLRRHDISARMIFARLAPVELAGEMACALRLTGVQDSRMSAVRVIRIPALLNAHEQLVIGSGCSWTGDVLRRAEGNRNGLDLWEDNSCGAARLAQFAFNSIWSASTPVPAKVLSSRRSILRDAVWMSASAATAGMASAMTKRPTARSSFRQH